MLTNDQFKVAFAEVLAILRIDGVSGLMAALSGPDRKHVGASLLRVQAGAAATFATYLDGGGLIFGSDPVVIEDEYVELCELAKLKVPSEGRGGAVLLRLLLPLLLKWLDEFLRELSD